MVAEGADRWRQQQGLTLVELMIALTLGMVLMAGVMEIFHSSHQGYRLLQAKQELQARGRFALRLLARDLRSADFWGCAARGSLNSVLLPGVAVPLVGLAGSSADGVNGSDSLQLSGGYGSALQPQQLTPLVVNDDRATAALNSGDYLLVADCDRGTLLQITESRDLGATRQLSLSGGIVTTDLNRTLIYPVTQRSYQIVSDSNNQPVLRLTINSNGNPQSQDLLEGVEVMRLQFGYDSDGDITPNRYLSAAAVPDFQQVTTVRIELLLRSLEDFLTTAPQHYHFDGAEHIAADHRLRQRFTTTVRVRNRR